MEEEFDPFADNNEELEAALADVDLDLTELDEAEEDLKMERKAEMFGLPEPAPRSLGRRPSGQNVRITEDDESPERRAVSPAAMAMPLSSFHPAISSGINGGRRQSDDRTGTPAKLAEEDDPPAHHSGCSQTRTVQQPESGAVDPARN